MRDIGVTARLFGKIYEEDPKYDANVDLIFDLKINMKNAGILARCFNP